MSKFGIKGELSNDLKEQIRQIVREEIAAHEERRHQEVIFFSRCDCRTDSVKPYYGQPVSFSNQ